MQTVSIKTVSKLDEKEPKKSRTARDLDNVLEKCKNNKWPNVEDFLLDRATNSNKTALGYWTGICHLNDFILKRYKGEYNVQTIIEPLKQERIDVYELLRLFLRYVRLEMPNSTKITTSSVLNYAKGAKQYFLFSDIDILPHKFKARVKLPQLNREDEQALDSNDVVEILHHIDNRRLKAYVLLLASGGMRAVEALAIRECDIDWSGINFKTDGPTDKLQPARVHIRKEYCKTKRSRDIFISNEAARYLNSWLDWKYRLQGDGARANALAEGELVFARVGRGIEADPARMYTSMALEFSRVLDKTKFGARKSGATARRVITLHSFRRLVKTIVEKHTSDNYSSWLLGHAKSSYWVEKPEERRRIYKDKCLKYLTYLDYSALQTTSNDLEEKLQSVIEQKDKEIAELERRYNIKESESKQNADVLGDLTETVKQLQKEMAEMKKSRH